MPRHAHATSATNCVLKACGTCRASDKCQREKRKTVNGDDILWAMQSLGFDDAVTVLTTYLAKIREVGLRACSDAHARRCITLASVAEAHCKVLRAAQQFANACAADKHCCHATGAV